jgi:hypothetical protein
VRFVHWEEPREAEVDDLYCKVLGEDYVRRFEIFVDDSLFVDVTNSADELPDNQIEFVRGDTLRMLFEIIFESAKRTILHHDV